MPVTIPEDIASNIQKLSPGSMVSLFEVDLTVIGGSTILYFTDVIGEDSLPIIFNSQEYTPVQIETENFEMSGTEQSNLPVIRIGNATAILTSYLTGFKDFVGATLTRKKTMVEYLDGYPNADHTQIMKLDEYFIARKIKQDNVAVEFELAPYTAKYNKKLPNRIILRDWCTHKYRIYLDGDFVYTQATCPYARDKGAVASYFTRYGVHTTNPANDKCGKTLADCTLRYACKRAFGNSTSSSVLTIATSAPGGPSKNDYWLNTNYEPNVLYKYNGTSWIEYKPDQLPTRAFPSVARLRL